VRELGLEVRAGLHTGECEIIDGKIGGIAAHIGVVDGLDAVVVGVEEEAAVVVAVVDRPRARLAVASVAGLHCRRPERIDVGSRAGDERDVEIAG
jgi:hypothetical protein